MTIAKSWDSSFDLFFISGFMFYLIDVLSFLCTYYTRFSPFCCTDE